MARTSDAADIPPPSVMGTWEISQRLGVSHQRVYQLVRERTFPLPAELHMGKVWATAAVEAWIRKHRPELAR